MTSNTTVGCLTGYPLILVYCVVHVGSRNPDASRQVRCVSCQISLLHKEIRVHPHVCARR